MVKKCRGVAEIAVMELDLRTRPPSTSLVSPNKRKITAGTDFQFEFSTATTTTSFLSLRSRRRRRILLPEPRTSSTSPGSDHDDYDDDDVDGDASAFCCSSSNGGCSEVVEESRVIEFVDLEDENTNDELGVLAHETSSRDQRRETTPSSKFGSPQSDDMESPAAKSEATSGDRSLSAKMPSESDLEEFFISAEKNLQKCFAEKYNYDIVEDVPLEGRYEWIRLKP